MARRASSTRQPQQSRAERDYEEIRAYLGDEALERTEVRQALRAQGIAVPERIDEQDTQELPAVSTTDTGDEQVDELNQSVVEMEAAHEDRKRANKLRKEKPDTDAAARQAAADKLEKLRGQALDLARQNQQAAARPINQLADRIGSASTPGGIPALLLILAALLLILVPVNGQPRLVWFWLVLTGKAHLVSEQKAATTQATPVSVAPSVGTNGAGAAAASAALPSFITSSGSGTLDRYVNP